MMQLKAHSQVEWEHHEEELRRHIAQLEREKEVRILKIFPILTFSFNKKSTQNQYQKVEFCEKNLKNYSKFEISKKKLILGKTGNARGQKVGIQTPRKKRRWQARWSSETGKTSHQIERQIIGSKSHQNFNFDCNRVIPIRGVQR